MNKGHAYSLLGEKDPKPAPHIFIKWILQLWKQFVSFLCLIYKKIVTQEKKAVAVVSDRKCICNPSFNAYQRYSSEPVKSCPVHPLSARPTPLVKRGNVISLCWCTLFFTFLFFTIFVPTGLDALLNQTIFLWWCCFLWFWWVNISNWVRRIMWVDLHHVCLSNVDSVQLHLYGSMRVDSLRRIREHLQQTHLLMYFRTYVLGYTSGNPTNILSVMVEIKFMR